MRSVFALVMVVSLAAVASSQTVVVDADGADNGKYWVEVVVDDGTVTATVIESDSVIVLSGQGGGGGEQPGDIDGIAKVSLEAKQLVTGDPNKDQNATKLSVLYDALADKIGSTFTHEGGDAPWQKLANVTKQSREVLLGDASPDWITWSGAIAKALAEMEAKDQLGTNEQMAQAYRDIAEGLIADLSQQELDEQWVELIMMILELIIQLLG
jgi:hypothetical protein